MGPEHVNKSNNDDEKKLVSKIVNQNSRKRSQDPSFKPPVTPWNLAVLNMEDEGGYQRSNLLGADGGNYYPWSKRMEARLIDKNCWNAIDPGFGDAVHENPDEAAAIAGLNQEQQRVNRKARGLIFDALHSTTLYDVGEFQLAKRAWDTLREMFGEFGIIHAMMFYKELTRLEKTPEMSMTDYISKMHELVQKVRMGGIPVSDISFAVLMLLGLPLKQYDSFIRSFEGDINALTSKSVKGKLMMEERRATLNAKAEETIALKKSSPHCQQQNGRSERQNRTLFEMARSMMSEAGAEKKWWAEALSTAAYIRNRTPCSAINFEIPTEVLYKKKLELSDYEKLHPFGCRVQAMREIRGKLDPKTVECVMLGYEENTKDGYRLLNLETGKLIIRRDAVFHEDSFPWRENTKEKKIHYPDVMGDSEESEEETEAEIPSDNDDQQHEDGEQVVFQIPDLPDDEVQVEIPEVIPPVLRRSARRPKPKKQYLSPTMSPMETVTIWNTEEL
ncbi:hypothetical protein FOCC_FOCC006055 [Frankliniella occidentalis]|nr:hypothetical protein FOCC_FOCC006055 [Frankliniella occidentalis]